MNKSNNGRNYADKAVVGIVCDLSDFNTRSDESVQRFQAIIDEAFGRSKKD